MEKRERAYAGHCQQRTDSRDPLPPYSPYGPIGRWRGRCKGRNRFRWAQFERRNVTTPGEVDRHRILRKSPESAEHVVDPLKNALKAMLGDDSLSELRLDAVFELVMGMQATWLALGHRPTPKEIQEVADTVLLIVTTPMKPARS